MCCQCDLRWLAGKARESICANLVSELPIEKWPRVNATGSLESEERGDNGCEFSIDSISIANALNFSYVNDSRERISTTRFQWCSTNNLTTIFYALPKWGCHEAARDFIDDEESLNLISDEVSIIRYLTKIVQLSEKALRHIPRRFFWARGDLEAVRQRAYDELKEQSEGNAKYSRSAGPVINMLLNDRQLFDFAEPSKTTRIFVIANHVIAKHVTR